MKNNIGKKIMNYRCLVPGWSLFYLLTFSFLLFNSFNYLDPDLGWHLRVGEDILASGSAPRADLYNFTLEGRTWVDHEWLFDAALYWIYDRLGYLALNIFFALIIVATMILMNVFVHRALPAIAPAVKTGLIAFFQIFGLLAMAPHLGIRMQEISLLYLVILLAALHRYGRTGNPRILAVLPPLFCLWANTHGSFLIGLFLVFLTAGIKAAENILARRGRFGFFDFGHVLGGGRVAVLAAAGAASSAAALINPYGLRLYGFLGDYADTFYMTRIAEWLPAWYLPLEYKQLVYLALFSAAVILWAVFAVTSRGRDGEKIDPWRFCLGLLFLALAFKSKRHFPLFFVISFPVLIEFFGRGAGSPPSFARFLKNNVLIRLFVLAAMILAIAGLALKTNFTGDPFASPRLCARFPCEATEWLKNRPEYHDLKIFNTYGWGGYLLWQWPEKKIFIDGRLPQLPFAGHTMLEEYFEFFEEGKTRVKLGQYDIGLVIIAKESKTERNWFEKRFLSAKNYAAEEKEDFLRGYLDGAGNWKLVYTDNASDVYAKTD